MTGENDERLARDKACHQLLLGLAGRVPDDLLTQCRIWLADGDVARLASGVTFWAVAHDATLSESDVGVLSMLLIEADADPAEAAKIRLDDIDPMPYYEFTADIPAELDGGVPSTSAAGARARAKRAKVEQAARKAVEAERAATGLWGAWRIPAAGAPWPPPRRVFVVEVPAGADEPAVAGRMQRRLVTAGEVSPQVEVYQTGNELPLYQEYARFAGELLWAAAEDPGIQIAAVFDEFDAATGPRFQPDHSRLEEAEADKIARYLNAGEPLLITMAQLDDMVDPSQLYCVPMSFRTDGTWIWTDASAYYVERHRLEPDSGLLAHLRSNDYTIPRVDGVAVYRALQVLAQSSGEESVWIPGSGTPGNEAGD